MRKTKYAGVYQRCTRDCPDVCRRHKFSYHADLGTDADGKRRQETKGGFATAAAARDARAELLRKHKQGTLPTTRNLTVGAWLEQWFETRKANGLRPSTARSYRQHIETYFKPHLGTIRLAELRPAHLQTMYTTIRAERGVSGATIVRINATMKSALSAAMRAGEIERNAAKLVELPEGKRPKIRVWTPEQFGQFLDAVADHPLYSLFVVAGHAGLRRGELCALRWEDVDLDTGVLVVRRQAVQVGHEVVIGRPKTASSEEGIVHLDADTCDVLRRHRKTQLEQRVACGTDWSDDDGLVFTAEAGRSWHPERVSKTFGRLVKAAGLPKARLHDLRHLSASLQLAAGVDMAVISKRHRHSSISITADTYSHLYDTTGAEAAEKVASLMRRARGAS